MKSEEIQERVKASLEANAPEADIERLQAAMLAPGFLPFVADMIGLVAQVLLMKMIEGQMAVNQAREMEPEPVLDSDNPSPVGVCSQCKEELHHVVGEDSEGRPLAFCNNCFEDVLLKVYRTEPGSEPL